MLVLQITRRQAKALLEKKMLEVRNSITAAAGRAAADKGL